MSHFLITGASSGLGLQFGLAALRRGSRVTGATRDPARARAASPEFEARGGVWLQLDVASPAAEATVRDVVESGDVDVLINSAAYALIGPVEKIRCAPPQS